MNLKTFTASTMPEALALVRQQYGSHGVILHTRSYKRGGILGLGAKTVVEVTAADGREIGRQRRREATQSPRAQVAAAMPRRQPAPAPAEAPLAGDLIRKTYAAAKADFEKQHARRPSPPAPPAVTVGTISTRDAEQLAAEMRAVKQMVTELMRQRAEAEPVRPAVVIKPSKKPDVPQPLLEQYTALMSQEVSEELAREVVHAVRQKLTVDQLQDKDACRLAVQAAVRDLLPTGTDAITLVPASDGRPRTIALVGPTGVGKTTTVAKLAATFKLKQHRKVGLITLDTYRIAAVDQLRTYAGIIGVPLHVAMNERELAEAMEACSDCDVVLIDTAGRAPRDAQRLAELSRYLEIARPHETHLVLSSTCTQTAMLDAVERFSRVRTDRIIFTKMDEAVTFGVVLNVARKVNKQLSFITTGQEVPHQIEAGNPGRIAALVTGEALQAS